VICGLGESRDIQCNYQNNSWNVVGSVYLCELQTALNIKSKESVVINSAIGSHLSGKNNDDVTCFISSEASYVVEYFPRNLENIFKNLKMIAIEHGRLKEIKQSDLRPFPKLVTVWLSNNDIEFLEDGLFAYNPELVSVNFHYNKIIHIGTQVFENLNKLRWLWLNENKCINLDAYNNQKAVREIIRQTKSKCFVKYAINLVTLKDNQTKLALSALVDQIHNIENTIQSINHKIDENSENEDFMNIVIVTSSAIMCVIYIVLIVIALRINTPNSNSSASEGDT
jgi:Leucine-rich repeat (LRR) protein